MTKPTVSLLVTLDSGLAYGIQKFLLSVLALVLPLLGVFGLVFTYESCFEHGRGVMELSRFEIITFVLFIALERRYSYYRQLFGYTFWQGLWRLFSALGLATLIVGIGALLHKQVALPIQPILLQPLLLSAYLLAVYLGTPAAFINSLAIEQARTEADENSSNTSDMESKL